MRAVAFFIDWGVGEVSFFLLQKGVRLGNKLKKSLYSLLYTCGNTDFAEDIKKVAKHTRVCDSRGEIVFLLKLAKIALRL